MNKHQLALKATKEALPELVKNTAIEGGYLMVSDEVATILVKKGWGEINEEIKDESGNVAARSTESVLVEFPEITDFLAAQEEAKTELNEVPEEKNTMSQFQIEDVPVVKTRTRNLASKYPFDDLEVGQSFFVAATEEKPEPWKAAAGAIATANRKHSEPLFKDGAPVMRINKAQNEVQAAKQLRKFVSNKETVGDVVGVRMGRVALAE